MARSDLTRKWLAYAVCLLFVAVFQQFVLDRLQFFGVVPFISPIIIALIAAYEGSTEGTIFSIIYAAVCEFAGYVAPPGIYVISFFAAALLVSIIARYWVARNVFGAIVYSFISFVIIDFFRLAYFMLMQGVSFANLGDIALREIGVSIVFAIPLYFLIEKLHNKYTRD